MLLLISRAASQGKTAHGSMDWLREIEIKDLLTGDVALIEEACGLDILIQLWEKLPSINLFISTKPLREARKRYIRKFYDGSNVKNLAQMLNCSERFVWETIGEKKRKGD